MIFQHKTQKLLGSNLGQLRPTFTQYNTPFQVVDKAIGEEEMIQTWLDESNCRAERYFESGRNMEEEETARTTRTHLEVATMLGRRSFTEGFELAVCMQN